MGLGQKEPKLNRYVGPRELGGRFWLNAVGSPLCGSGEAGVDIMEAEA